MPRQWRAREQSRGPTQAGQSANSLPELRVDVAVEIREALVAAELGPLRAEEAAGGGRLAHGSPSRARWARRLRRASWRVL
jgi:hypothetical protein